MSANVSIFLNAVDRTAPVVAGVARRFTSAGRQIAAGFMAVPRAIAGAMSSLGAVPAIAPLLSGFTQLRAIAAGVSLQVRQITSSVSQLVAGAVTRIPALVGQLPVAVGLALNQISSQLGLFLGQIPVRIGLLLNQISTRVMLAGQQILMQVNLVLGQIPQRIGLIAAQLSMRVTMLVQQIRMQVTAGALAIVQQVSAVGAQLVARVGVVRAQVVGAVRAGVPMVVGAVRSAGSAIVAAVSAIGGRMVAAGRNLMASLAAGIRSGIGLVTAAAGAAAGAIASFVPNSPVPAGPLRILNNISSNPGAKIMEMIGSGLSSVDLSRFSFGKPSSDTSGGLGGFLSNSGQNVAGAMGSVLQWIRTLISRPPPPPPATPVDLAGNLPTLKVSPATIAQERGVTLVPSGDTFGQQSFIAELLNQANAERRADDRRRAALKRRNTRPDEIGYGTTMAEFLAARDFSQDLGMTAFLRELFNDSGVSIPAPSGVSDAELWVGLYELLGGNPSTFPGGGAGRGGGGRRGGGAGGPSAGAGGGRTGGGAAGSGGATAAGGAVGGGGGQRSTLPGSTTPQVKSGPAPLPPSLPLPSAVGQVVVYLTYSPTIYIELPDKPDFEQVLEEHSRHIVDMVGRGLESVRGRLNYG